MIDLSINKVGLEHNIRFLRLSGSPSGDRTV